LNFGQWCCRVTNGLHCSQRDEAFALPSGTGKTSEGCGRSGTDLLKCTDLPERPGIATEPLDAQIGNRRKESILFPIARSAQPVCSASALRFRCVWPPAISRRFAGLFLRSMSAGAPQKIRQLVGSGSSVRLIFVLNHLPAVNFPGGQHANFLRPMEEKKCENPLFRIPPLKRFS